MPPSTVSVAPVTNELSSLARKSMARATSSGLARGALRADHLPVPVWVTLPLLLPAAFAVGVALQVTLFGRALRGGVLAPVLVTFGRSMMIENLLQVAATSDPRGLAGGGLALASFRIGSQITVSWLFMTAFLTACAVLSGLQLLLSRTSWGRTVRATADDPDTARLVGIRVRPVFATVMGIAVATAALAGVFIGTIEGPVLGALVLFGLQEALSSYGAWYLVIVGGLAVAATLIASRGLWGFAADRFGWSLLPVGYRVRPPGG